MHERTIFPSPKNMGSLKQRFPDSYRIYSDSDDEDEKEIPYEKIPKQFFDKGFKLHNVSILTDPSAAVFRAYIIQVLEKISAKEMWDFLTELYQLNCSEVVTKEEILGLSKKYIEKNTINIHDQLKVKILNELTQKAPSLYAFKPAASEVFDQYILNNAEINSQEEGLLKLYDDAKEDLKEKQINALHLFLKLDSFTRLKILKEHEDIILKSHEMKAELAKILKASHQQNIDEFTKSFQSFCDKWLRLFKEYSQLKIDGSDGNLNSGYIQELVVTMARPRAMPDLRREVLDKGIKVAISNTIRSAAEADQAVVSAQAELDAKARMRLI